MNAPAMIASLFVIGGFVPLIATPAADKNLPRTATPNTACLDDTWNPMTPAPSNAGGGPYVWTGYEMIFVGGIGQSGQPLPGARYNPRTDSWSITSINRPPNPSFAYSTVWTGTEIIVWGGYTGNFVPQATGARYNPSTDTWTALSTVNAPAARYNHGAVWTGSEMIVWGGDMADSVNGLLNSGGRYNPITDTWAPMTNDGAPSARDTFSATWTGSEMVVWGGHNHTTGYSNTGGRYNPDTDTWVATSTINAPSARSGHTAVWTGSELIVWGSTSDGSGGRYNPSTDTWIPTSPGPSARTRHSALWTGSEMIVWGGYSAMSSQYAFNDGSRYNPTNDSWTPVTSNGAPAPRAQHFAVWTGGKMIIWGGVYTSGHNVYGLNDGAIYCVRSPFALIHAASAGTHGIVPFDVGLPTRGTIAVESRTGDGSARGSYTFALTFTDPIASVDSQSISCGSVTATSTSDNTYSVQFDASGCDQQYVTLTLSGVHDAYNDTLPSASATIGLLIGDSNGDGRVNAADAQQLRNRSGRSADGSNFRLDMNLDGAINSADATLLRARSGNSLPPVGAETRNIR